MTSPRLDGKDRGLDRFGGLLTAPLGFLRIRRKVRTEDALDDRGHPAPLGPGEVAETRRHDLIDPSPGLIEP